MQKQTWVDLQPGEHIMLGDRIITAAGFAPVERCIGKRFDPDEHVCVQRSSDSVSLPVIATTTPERFDAKTKIYEAVYKNALTPADAAEILKMIRKAEQDNEDRDVLAEITFMKYDIEALKRDIYQQSFDTKCTLRIISNYVNMQGSRRGIWGTIVWYFKGVLDLGR